MPSSLIFPAGVRLSTLDEIPGPEATRSATWEKVQRAAISPGYVLHDASDAKFSVYAEINVDAPKLWGLFTELSQTLLGERSVLLIGEIDEDPAQVDPAGTAAFLTVLAPHSYQLSNDGWVQFGLAAISDDSLVEVFVTPTKYLQVWCSDKRALQHVLNKHGLTETEHLEFLDEYARTTTSLPRGSTSFESRTELIEYLKQALTGRAH